MMKYAVLFIAIFSAACTAPARAQTDSGLLAPAPQANQDASYQDMTKQLESLRAQEQQSASSSVDELIRLQAEQAIQGVNADAAQNGALPTAAPPKKPTSYGFLTPDPNAAPDSSSRGDTSMGGLLAPN